MVKKDNKKIIIDINDIKINYFCFYLILMNYNYFTLNVITSF